MVCPSMMLHTWNWRSGKRYRSQPWMLNLPRRHAPRVLNFYDCEQIAKWTDLACRTRPARSSELYCGIAGVRCVGTTLLVLNQMLIFSHVDANFRIDLLQCLPFGLQNRVGIVVGCAYPNQLRDECDVRTCGGNEVGRRASTFCVFHFRCTVPSQLRRPVDHARRDRLNQRGSRWRLCWFRCSTSRLRR